jgi:hypothetical protein
VNLLTSKNILLVNKKKLPASKINLLAGKNNLQASKWLVPSHFDYDLGHEIGAPRF